MNATALSDNPLAPSGKPWAYGIRTWDKDEGAHSGFTWNLEIGSRTTAPDFKPAAACGNGLHANPYGVGDWSLLGDLSEVVTSGRVLGIVRYDPDLAIDLDGKIKAPWMDVVMTTKSAGMGSILGFLAPKRHEHILSVAKRSDKTLSTTGDYSAAATTGASSAAATTGDYSAAATTGASSAAATTGYRSAAATTGASSAAATTGDYSAAATTGKNSIAAALGDGGTAKAAETGAIMLAAYSWVGDERKLVAVFAGMVGETYGRVKIKPGVAYRLNVNGKVEVAK